ncbi:hypothetical protein GCM10010446_11170 [Streptomyces enissocaesilis]|uniref:Uncharacterized protein n=1 Tax=Streptomyces enissocaesilis TaxID=332589 RepID=A0ABN3WUK7_9ACTN
MRGAAPQRHQTGQRAAGPCGAARGAGGGQDLAGVVVGDGPVRAEGQDGPGVAQVAAAPGAGRASAAEALGPFAGVAGAGVRGVGRLHRGDHAELGGAGGPVPGDGLDVLDAVAQPSDRAGGFDGVQDVAHGGVTVRTRPR